MSIKEILLLLMTAILTACSANPGQNSDGAVSGGVSAIEQTPPAVSVPVTEEATSGTEQTSGMQTGIIKDQILDGADGEIHYPLYCPKCKQEHLIEAKNLIVTVIKEPDTKMQSR